MKVSAQDVDSFSAHPFTSFLELGSYLPPTSGSFLAHSADSIIRNPPIKRTSEPLPKLPVQTKVSTF